MRSDFMIALHDTLEGHKDGELILRQDGTRTPACNLSRQDIPSERVRELILEAVAAFKDDKLKFTILMWSATDSVLFWKMQKEAQPVLYVARPPCLLHPVGWLTGAPIPPSLTQSTDT